MDDQQISHETNEKLAMLGDRLMRHVDRRVRERASLEDRWLEDLRQYNSRYDPRTEANIRADPTRSRVFVNLTRAKVNAAESRLSEMLFPNDQRNYGVSPTPVPELTQALARGGTVIDQSGQPMLDQQGSPVDAAQRAAQIVHEARVRAKLMEDEISDQLDESGYVQACRELIHHGCVLGTGILKGPVVVGRMREAWSSLESETGEKVRILKREVDPRPAVVHVNPWDFYPDLGVSTIDESEFELERHRMTRRDLIKMINDPGVIKDNVRALLKTDPEERRTTSFWTNEKRQISGVANASAPSSGLDNRYELWEYNGPITREDMELCGCDVPSEEEDDPLEMIEATLLFGNGIVVKAMIHPMDTRAKIYSVWNWERDDTSIFGFGVPYQTRNPQRVVNGAWRLVMENGALSSGPQILMHRNKVEPADGQWRLTPKKIWYATSESSRLEDVFTTVDIPNRQQDLMQIIAKAERFFEDETSLPLLAQGQQAPGTTKTAAGMSLLMNSANTVLRRAVRYFDDGIIIPTIKRFYDWNMQYGERDEIKGDFEVKARASSVLLVREVQAQNLQQLLGMAAKVPPLGQLTKWAPAYRKAVQAMQLEGEEIVKSDDEIAAEERSRAQAPPDPQILKIELDKQKLEAEIQDREAQRQHEMQMKQLDREIKMMELAKDREIGLERIAASLRASRMREQNKRDLYADERDLKIATGQGI